ncbi:MAG: trimethylamine methyltransferase family protein [Dehalococcoidia bacterium]|nr:trimethylamine methyltransferase family protein [Dehalococcoidia bacterium]
MSKPRTTFLSQEEIEAIHNASLRVLEKTGIKVMSETALDVLKKGGAKVDYGTNHATLPRQLVEEALEMAPKTITYGARNPKYDFVLNKQEPHFCPTGDPPFILDWETGQRRYSTAEDVANCAVIADYLDHVQLTWVMLTPTEVPAPMQHLVGICTCLRNTEKHVEDEALSARSAQYQVEIATAIVGDSKRLRERPIYSAVQCPFSPLTYDKGITEGAIELGKAGIPVVLYPLPLGGMTGPATPAGTMVIANADVLGGLVIQELASPGAPVVYSAGAGTVNFQNGERIRSPEGPLMQLGLGQLARYYGLPDERPVFYGASKLLSRQSDHYRVEALLTQMSIEPVPDIVLGLGGLEGTTSPEAMVIDNEIVDYALRFAQGIEVNDETLAVDVIDKAGPGGHYLGERHTLKHFRERWMPRLDVDRLETWEKEGIKSLGELAHEKVKEILATHKPTPLPEDVDREICHILKKAQEKA